MATERALFKAEIKRLKKDLSRETERLLKSANVDEAETNCLTWILNDLVVAQRKLNATYQSPDERIILERARRKVGGR